MQSLRRQSQLLNLRYLNLKIIFTCDNMSIRYQSPRADKIETAVFSSVNGNQPRPFTPIVALSTEDERLTLVASGYDAAFNSCWSWIG